MYRWTVQKLTRSVLARLRSGDPRMLLALMTDDVHFRFLGNHTWAADYHEKSKVRAWLERYRQARLELQPLDVVVSGPPWNTLICTRFTDRATDERGEVIYQNEGVLFDRLVWGRIREHVSYEDTQRTVEFDHRIARFVEAPLGGWVRFVRGFRRPRSRSLTVDRVLRGNFVLVEGGRHSFLAARERAT